MKLLLPLALGASLVLIGCSRPEPAQEPVRAVRVMTIGVDAMQAAHEFAGEVRARTEVRLGFRVAGKILQRQAEVGQHVKAGQTLAQLDPQDYKLAVDAARAQLAAAVTNRELAAADFKRYKELRDQNFISSAELERRDTALKSAQAQLDQAQAQLANQGNQAGYTHLTSDVFGVVTAVEAEPGQVVSAGAPVVRIAQDGPRDVLFSVPEDKIKALKLGSEVLVRGWASEGSWRAKVREIGASADALTRTFQVKVGLEGSDVPALGSTVYVVPKDLSAQGVPAIKLPTSALRQEGSGTAVWVLDNGSMTVRSQAIQIATADGNEAVVAAGLKPGQQVVTAGVHVLSPGQKVTMFNDKASAASRAASAPAVSSSAAASTAR